MAPLSYQSSGLHQRRVNKQISVVPARDMAISGGHTTMAVMLLGEYLARGFLSTQTESW